MTRHLTAAAFVLVFSLISTACQDTDDPSHQQDHMMASDSMMAQPQQPTTEAVCQIGPTQGNTAHGTIRFTQTGDKVKVVADISGLKPNSKHGFHIHEGTECAEDGMKAGGHYNPENNPHGLPDQPKRHAGDLGNLEANAQGTAHYELTVNNITINGQKNPILGRAVIVHADPDDGSQPAGNAGARIGCGVIQAASAPAQ